MDGGSGPKPMVPTNPLSVPIREGLDFILGKSKSFVWTGRKELAMAKVSQITSSSMPCLLAVDHEVKKLMAENPSKSRTYSPKLILRGLWMLHRLNDPAHRSSHLSCLELLDRAVPSPSPPKTQPLHRYNLPSYHLPCIFPPAGRNESRSPTVTSPSGLYTAFQHLQYFRWWWWWCCRQSSKKGKVVSQNIELDQPRIVSGFGGKVGWEQMVLSASYTIFESSFLTRRK